MPKRQAGGCDFILLCHFLILCRFRRCPGIRRVSGLATHRGASKPSECEAALLLGLDSLRSCNAHPLATFATRKLLALLVGEPDRFATGAFSRLDNKPFSAYLASTKPLVAYEHLSYGYNHSRGLTRRTPLYLLLRRRYFFNTRNKIYDLLCPHCECIEDREPFREFNVSQTGKRR